MELKGALIHGSVGLGIRTFVNSRGIIGCVVLLIADCDTQVPLLGPLILARALGPNSVLVDVLMLNSNKNRTNNEVPSSR